MKIRTKLIPVRHQENMDIIKEIAGGRNVVVSKEKSLRNNISKPEDKVVR